MRRLIKRFAILFLLVLAACEPAVYSVTQDRLYTPSRFRFAAGEPILTVIRGQPFADRKLEEAVLTAMARGVQTFDVALQRRPHFTTDPATRSRYRVVLAFAPAAPPAAYCAKPNEAPVGTPAGDVVHARMVFCDGKVVMSTTVGTVSGVKAADDPRFQRMIAEMTRELFPQRKFRDGFESGPASANMPQ